MYGYVYCTTNLITGCMYIGRHASSVFDEKYFGSGKILKRAIKKYGENNFSIVILCEAESYEDLAEKERYYIALSDAVNRKDFYNIGRGGEGFPSGENHPNYGKKGKDAFGWGKVHTDKFKEYMSRIRKGMKFSFDHKQKLSQKKLGDATLNKGRRVSEDTKAKLSQINKDAQLNRKMGIKQNGRIRTFHEFLHGFKVAIYFTDGSIKTFDSMKACARYTSLKHRVRHINTIKRIINGETLPPEGVRKICYI